MYETNFRRKYIFFTGVSNFKDFKTIFLCSNLIGLVTYCEGQFDI